MDWNKRITPKDAQKMMDAYAKVYAPKEEPKPETEATAETEAPVDTAEKDKQKVFTREKMSKFGDLIAGVSGVPVVETPAPVVEEVPAPVVEEAPAPVVEEEPPRPEEEVADTIATPVSFESMSKDELEDYGRTVGIELDRRHNKKKLIKELEDHLATS